MVDSPAGGGPAPVRPRAEPSAAVPLTGTDPAPHPAPPPPRAACPPHVLAAIHGGGTGSADADVADKKAAYDRSLNRWWEAYSDRKNDEADEHVADSLLYDRNHLPRSAPAPECVAGGGGRGGGSGGQAGPGTPTPGED